MADPFELPREQVRALTHPHVPAADAVRAAVLDCTGVEEFTADAIGHLAERLTCHLNAFTLEGASKELAAAFTDKSVYDAQFERIFAVLNPGMSAARRNADRHDD